MTIKLKDYKVKEKYKKLKNNIKEFLDKNINKDLNQFKPAIVEIQDEPASPTGRIVAWSICSLILIAIVWSSLAEIDIIATAQGKIVPVGNTKIVQSHIDGTINKIYVKDGDFVKKDDLLLDINSDVYIAEKSALEKSLFAENIKYNRSKAMINYLANKENKELETIPNAYLSTEMQIMLFEQEYRDLESNLAMLEDSLTQKKHELENVKINISNYKKTVALTEIRSKKIQGLLEQKISSEMEFMEFEEKRIKEINDLESLKSKEKQLIANIKELNEKITYAKIENKKKHLVTIEESLNNINRIKEDINKNEVMIRYSRIYSPVNGYIQEMKFHTVGGVLEQAQEILKIVEDKSDIEVEALISSRDIGFIENGMDVAIKVDTFLFTKYGLVHGKITNISGDAITDEKLGLVYKTKIKLNEKFIKVDNKKVQLSYGMSVTSEIKTSKRTVLEFFLSPITKALNESVKER
jgi:hemolysin D